MNVTSLAPGMQNVSIRGDPLVRKNVATSSNSSAASRENAEASSPSPSAPQQAALPVQPVSAPSDSAYMANREASAHVADAFVKLTTPNSDLQQTISQVVNARQFAPVDTDVVANVAGLVGKMFDLGD
jgi:hypothetical protein